MIEGLMLGIFHVQIADLHDCFNSTQSVVDAVKEQLRSSEEAKTKVGMATDAIAVAGYILSNMGTSLTECMGAEMQIQRLFQVQLALGSKQEVKTTIVDNLQLSGLSILANIQYMVTYMRADDWFNFGNQLGQVVKTLFMKDVAPMTDLDILAFDFMNGFFENSDESIDFQTIYLYGSGLGNQLWQPLSDYMNSISDDDVTSTLVVNSMQEVGDILVETVSGLEELKMVTGTFSNHIED